MLKVAHHGSADEGLRALLERLRPAAAVIPVGRRQPLRPSAPGDHARAALGRSAAVPHRPRRRRDAHAGAAAARRFALSADPSSRLAPRWPTQARIPVQGDDEVKIDGWRSRVRERAAEDPEATLEVFPDKTPAGRGRGGAVQHDARDGPPLDAGRGRRALEGEGGPAGRGGARRPAAGHDRGPDRHRADQARQAGPGARQARQGGREVRRRGHDLQGADARPSTRGGRSSRPRRSG